MVDVSRLWIRQSRELDTRSNGALPPEIGMGIAFSSMPQG